MKATPNVENGAGRQAGRELLTMQKMRRDDPLGHGRKEVLAAREILRRNGIIPSAEHHAIRSD